MKAIIEILRPLFKSRTAFRCSVVLDDLTDAVPLSPVLDILTLPLGARTPLRGSSSSSCFAIKEGRASAVVYWYSLTMPGAPTIRFRCCACPTVRVSDYFYQHCPWSSCWEGRALAASGVFAAWRTVCADRITAKGEGLHLCVHSWWCKFVYPGGVQLRGRPLQLQSAHSLSASITFYSQHSLAIHPKHESRTNLGGRTQTDS